MSLKKPFCYMVPILFLILAVQAQVWAGEPTDAIKRTSDKILAIVTDPGLKDAARADERKSLIRKAVDERFDWEEMSRRSLARHWAQRTDEEKKEFIEVYGHLLERTYMDKVEGYSGEKVYYVGEEVDGAYGAVDVKIVTLKNVEIPVQYRLKKKGNEWFVYDISIEGVSLVNNYRAQFNSILMNSSYKELVKKLKDKMVEK
ncbi:MAG: ABC transporter substrate-binding protein [Pseudomonadota bacterium]